MANLDNNLLTLNLKLANSMHNEDWDKIDRLTYGTMEATRDSATRRQIKKFNDLQTKSSESPSTDLSRTVVNLSQRKLSAEETSILSKGGNFAITPDSVPFEDIIANIESGIRNLQADIAKEIRTESARILRRAKPPKSNVSSKEKRAIRDLNKDISVIVLPADKGNATVVLNTVDYEKKIGDLLDPKTYKKLQQDPTNRILKKTNTLIKKSSIEPEIQRKLSNSEAVPLRPIVSAIGSPTYHLAKHLTKLLEPLIGRTASHIKDSTQFIQKIKNITLSPKDILVSFDVVSLFTMVPVKETLDLISARFRNDVTELFRHCLTTTYFQWNKEFYEQVDGVAMGSPLSPVIANFFMEKFEQQALNTAQKKPKCWFRYVDDTFVIWSHGEKELQIFLAHLKSINNKIKFTMETEKDGRLAFLDVQVERRPNGKLGHKVYRKPTHTERPEQII
ncbi:uncharacterized protein LOC132706961 [Cylas formicarius]|uniref:uncharacterized protein LOC132706961 n=1 Tax=Cylas formicarius TaxID=197179 RepID=UPI002958D798|nr:uncharacterized protein LOC132706961 [Cylas formicarius]